ncbi:MAG TPA: ABC transporter substrate-binding protein [Myxococcaceae bacterium]|nr:ABC transporter substrate-binding protein [Myxococcaceae bacterium]
MGKVLSLVAGGVLALAPVGASFAQQQGVTADTITIGAYGPITGPAGYIGLGGRDGMNLAVKEINAAGGTQGRKIQVVFEDDSHSPTRALAAVRKLVEQDKVFALFSIAGSNSTVGTLEYVREKNIPLYVSFASAPQVTWPFSRVLFRGGTTEAPRYGELYAEFMVTHHKAKRIAIMSGREEYPKNEGEAVTRLLKAWFDLAPVARAEFNFGDKDFTPQLLEVQRANPEVIAFFGNPAEAAIALRQAKELGLKQPFFVGANMVDASLLSAAKSAAGGVTGFSLIPLLPGSKDPAMVKWETAWRKEYPNAPTGRPNTFDLLAYGDMHVVAEALRRAGKNLTHESFIKALESIDNYRVSPVASPRRFSSKHHIGNLTLQPMIVRNGEWQQVAWKPSRQSEILTRYLQQ